MDQDQTVDTSRSGKAAQLAASYASRAAPWRQDISWMWVAAEGALAALVGIYFMAFSDSANSTIRFLLAAILVAGSTIDIYSGFRNYKARHFDLPMTPYLLVRGGAGLAIGLIYFFSSWRGYMNETDARLVLGIGLVIYAAIGIGGNIVTLLTANLKWFGLGANILFFVMGAVLIYNNRESVDANDSVTYIGAAALVGGAILLVYSYFLKQNQETQPESIAEEMESGILEDAGTTTAQASSPASESAPASTTAEREEESGRDEQGN